MLSAMPDTTWLPWCVMQAKPCTRLTRTDAATPAPRPAQAEPVTAAVAAATDENDQPLDDHDHVAREVRHVERQLGPALIEGAEQDRRQPDPQRMIASHQRHRDADVPGAAGKVEEQAMLDPHDLVEAHEPGERPRDRHRHDHRPRRQNAAVHRGRLVVAEGPQLVAPARVPKIDPHPGAGGQRDEHGEVERRAADFPAQRAGHVVELGQPGVRIELTRLWRLLAWLDQDVDEEMRHQRRGDEVEHDRRDDDVAAASGLEPGGHECPGRAAGRRQNDRGRDDQRGRPAPGPETEQGDAETADVGLTLRADIEQPTVKGDGDGQTGEDEIGRVVERVADRLGVPDRAVREKPEGPCGTFADQDNHDRREQQCQGEVDHRQQRRSDPAAPGATRGRRFHSADYLAPRRRCRHSSNWCIRRSSGKRTIQSAATAIVPSPPSSTAGTVPKSAAARPDSKAPSWFEVPVNSECTALTRPRIVSGVRIWTSEARMTTLTTSDAPRTQSAASESAKLVETPNTTVAAPKTMTARNSVGPILR